MKGEDQLQIFRYLHRPQGRHIRAPCIPYGDMTNKGFYPTGEQSW